MRNTAHVALAAALAAAALGSGCAGSPVRELRTHANQSFDRGEYRRVVAFDTEILREQPDDVAATVQRGIAYDRLGNMADAEADFSRAIDLKPDASLPRLYRANIALKTSRADVAQSDLEALRALSLDTHERVAAAVLEGTVAQTRRDWIGALKSYKAAIDMGRQDPDPTTQKHTRDALANAAECQYRLGNFDQAAGLYQEYVHAKALVEEPVTEDDQYTLGILSYLRGDFVRAKHAFAQVSPARKKQAAKVLDDEGFFASTK